MYKFLKKNIIYLNIYYKHIIHSCYTNVKGGPLLRSGFGKLVDKCMLMCISSESSLIKMIKCIKVCILAQSSITSLKYKNAPITFIYTTTNCRALPNDLENLNFGCNII